MVNMGLLGRLVGCLEGLLRNKNRAPHGSHCRRTRERELVPPLPCPPSASLATPVQSRLIYQPQRPVYMVGAASHTLPGTVCAGSVMWQTFRSPPVAVTPGWATPRYGGFPSHASHRPLCSPIQLVCPGGNPVWTTSWIIHSTPAKGRMNCSTSRSTLMTGPEGSPSRPAAS
eukprot:s815_g28.t1